MRTMLELPDELMQQVEAAAAKAGTPTHEFMLQILESGLSTIEEDEAALARMQRGPFPVIWKATGKKTRSWTGGELQELFDQEDYPELFGAQNEAGDRRD